MATTPRVILAPTIAGGTSSTFYVESGPVTVRLSGDTASGVLAGDETATLQYLDANSNWTQHTDLVSGAGQMTAGMTVMFIYAKGTYRVVLSVTADECGLEIIDSFA